MAKTCDVAGRQHVKQYNVWVDMDCSLDDGHHGDHWDATFLLYWPGNLAQA